LGSAGSSKNEILDSSISNFNIFGDIFNVWIGNSNIGFTDFTGFSLQDVRILNCDINAFTADGPIDRLTMVGNVVSAGLTITQVPGGHFRGSRIDDNEITDGLIVDIFMQFSQFKNNHAGWLSFLSASSTSSHNQIQGNYSQGLSNNRGIGVQGHQFLIVSDNIVNSSDMGIALESVMDSNIEDNLIVNYSNGSADTFDGINILTSDRLNVQGNTCRSADGRYGINVISGNDNLVTNNDLLNSGNTGSFNNTATGTITVSGNRL
jgi:nitrous oxidase accessory protein NosD